MLMIIIIDDTVLMIITPKMISGTGFSFTKGGFAENETAVGLSVILAHNTNTNSNTNT